MEEEFEYGELVEVRDEDDQQWVKAVFVEKVVDVSYWAEMPDSPAAGYQQIRKFQPEPEPQPEPEKKEFISTNGNTYTKHEAILQLQERLEQLQEELHQLKNSIK